MWADMMPAMPVSMRTAERHQLDLLELVHRLRQRRQPQVRVHAGVAVPGEVLADGGDAAALQAAHVRRAEPRHDAAGRPSRSACR